MKSKAKTIEFVNPVTLEELSKAMGYFSKLWKVLGGTNPPTYDDFTRFLDGTPLVVTQFQVEDVLDNSLPKPEANCTIPGHRHKAKDCKGKP